jgi:hypothetical protein
MSNDSSQQITPNPSPSDSFHPKTSIPRHRAFSWAHQPHAKIAILALGIILSLGIFLFAASLHPYPYAPFMAGAITSVLTLAGWILAPHGGDSGKIIFNRMLSLFAIWGTA